jgi:hypothetical protein
MVRAAETQTRNANFLETGFTWYSLLFGIQQGKMERHARVGNICNVMVSRSIV